MSEIAHRLATSGERAVIRDRLSRACRRHLCVKDQAFRRS